MLQQLEALGLNLPSVLEQLGVGKQTNGAAAESAPPPAAEPEAPRKRDKG
jgi:hypothetical protein